MVFHLSVFVSVCLIALMAGPSATDESSRKKIVIILCTLILGTILALRTWWMADLIKYHTQYVTIAGRSFSELAESDLANLGLRLLFVIEHRLTGGNFQIVLFIESYFCMGCLGYIIYKYSPIPLWSYFAYMAVGLYFFNFSGLKQSIAMAFLLLAFDGIAQDKPVKFVILTFISGMFHAPAFIGIVAYYFANLKISKNYFLALIVVFVFVLIFRSQIVSVLSEMYYDETEVKDVGGFGGKFIMMVVLLVGGALLRPPVNEDSLYAKVFNLMVLAALIQSFSIFGHNFTRLADYYFQFLILYLPMIMKYPDYTSIENNEMAMPFLKFTEESYILAGGILFILGFYYYRSYIHTDISGVLNYKFFWEMSQSPWGS